MEGTGYLKDVIASWKAELQKIYDDTVGTMDEDTTPLKNVGEIDFEEKDDYHGYADYYVGMATDKPMNMIAEPCEVTRRTRGNAVVEMGGEIVVVTS